MIVYLLLFLIILCIILVYQFQKDLTTNYEPSTILFDQSTIVGIELDKEQERRMLEQIRRRLDEHDNQR